MSSREIKPIWGLLAIVLTMAAVVWGIETFGPRDRIPWRTDFAAARAEAAAGGKQLFVYFTADWCPPCRRMARSTWADGRVEAALSGAFVPVKIDVDRQPDLAASYAPHVLPTYAVMTADGEPRRVADGYVAAERMLAWLAAEAPPPPPEPVVTTTTTTTGE